MITLIRNLLIGMFIGGSWIVGLHLLHAQETAKPVQGGAISTVDWDSASDLQVLLQAVEMMPTVPAATAPRAGTFWSALHAPGTRSPWPPLPGNLNSLPVWNLGDDVYLLDDLQVDYSLPVSLRMAGGGMHAMDDSGGPIPGNGGGGSTNGYEYSFTRPVYTTNDLWLEITGKTNTTAYLTIHPPWIITNGVWDLVYTTNLSPPESWSWVLRSFAGVTNLVVNNATDAQGFYRLAPPINGTGSLGTNFWLAFFTMDPYALPGYYATNRELWLYISSPMGATGTVTIPGLGITNTFTVAAGAVTNISLTNTAMMGNPSYDVVGVIETNGIHVAASQPVSVYALFYEPCASAAFACYPTPLLGTNYCLMARPNLVNLGDSQFAIVATEDNTTVNITPSATANLLYIEGDETFIYTNTYSITLQQGQVYQIASCDADAVGSNPLIYIDDVTGTRIASDKPVAVFAGATLAFVPDVSTRAGNPLVQEQLPVETWGTQVPGLSFAGRTNGDSYRVLAAYSNTVVTITGTVVTVVDSNSIPHTVTTSNETVVVTNQAGQCYDIIMDGPVEFRSSQPIQAAHFANGTYFDHVLDPNMKGDPCEILLPPTGHYLATNVVYTPTGLDFDGNPFDFVTNYLNIIVAQSAITTTFVDTNLVAATNFVAIGGSGYYGAQLTVTNGIHKVTSSLPVGVEVYGFGPSDAYGYFGGVVK